MFGFKKVVVGDGERGLVYRNRRFERVLLPGVHRLWGAWGELAVRVCDATRPEYDGKDVDVLVDRLGGELGVYFVLADVGVNEAGLLSRSGKLEDVLPPGTRKLYWNGPVEVGVERIALNGTPDITEAVARRLRQVGVLDKHAVSTVVPEQFTGLLFVDGKLARQLAPGAYAFWNFRKNVAVELTDLRVQALEVAGQELLTRDKVSLRVNLAATLRVADPVAARTKVAKYLEHVYRELQFGLRKAVSAKTLDELLGDKASLDGDIFGHVRNRAAEAGVEVLGVGVKDVILPGEMKEILNSVVQAEKSAQANVIRRREETNAMRSALNTAKLMEENPILMRLKELEALEKVSEKVGKLTVFDGFDGVMNKLVKLGKD